MTEFVTELESVTESVTQLESVIEFVTEFRLFVTESVTDLEIRDRFFLMVITGTQTNSPTHGVRLRGRHFYLTPLWWSIAPNRLKSPVFAPAAPRGTRFGFESRAVGRNFFAQSGSFWSTPWDY